MEVIREREEVIVVKGGFIVVKVLVFLFGSTYTISPGRK